MIELEMQNEELRHARDELEAALEKYTDLYDFAPVGYMTLMAAASSSSINLTAAGLLGIERSQLIGRRFGLFVAESRAAFQDFLGQAMASHGKEACEVTLAGNDKEPLIVRLEAVACPAGKECRVAVIDITERKRIDGEIRRLHATLERRAFELEAANEELEAFAHTVSHDLRSPLTIAGGYCELLLNVCDDRLDEQCRGYLHEIDAGIQHMAELIDTLLNFSSLTRSELQTEPVDLSAMAGSIAGELAKQQPERRVTFTIEPGVVLNGDPELLRVVLKNLLGNAWKYTGRKDAAVIEFGTTQVAAKSVCFLRDNGPGFDSAHADLLFKPLQRLPGAKEFGGLGIGLATVQRIIQLHGGRVWAESVLGKGATFYFTLD